MVGGAIAHSDELPDGVLRFQSAQAVGDVCNHIGCGDNMGEYGVAIGCGHICHCLVIA